MNANDAKINGNRTAFPSADGSTGGLTKREYLAGVALQGLLANANESQALAQLNYIHDGKVPGLTVFTMAARNYADALLLALNEPPAVTNDK